MTYWRPHRGGNRKAATRRRRYEYSAQPPPAPTPSGPRACSRRQEGDEYVCHCGLRWAVDDQRPPCHHQGSY